MGPTVPTAVFRLAGHEQSQGGGLPAQWAAKPGCGKAHFTQRYPSTSGYMVVQFCQERRHINQLLLSPTHKVIYFSYLYPLFLFLSTPSVMFLENISIFKEEMNHSRRVQSDKRSSFLPESPTLKPVIAGPRPQLAIVLHQSWDATILRAS